MGRHVIVGKRELRNVAPEKSNFGIVTLTDGMPLHSRFVQKLERIQRLAIEGTDIEIEND